MTTRRARPPARRVTLLPATLTIVLLTALAAGCTDGGPRGRAGGAASAGPAPVPARSLEASVGQFRFDEGTRRLSAGVTNKGAQRIEVSTATLRWQGFAFPDVRVTDPVTEPGQTAAFAVSYGAPRCAHPPTDPPVLVATVDRQVRRLPLHVDEPGLLRRLWAKACARQRLDRAVGIRLRLSREPRRVAGEWSVPAVVVLRRRAGHQPVDVVDLGGSVLIQLNPRGGRGTLPGRLPADRSLLRFPVLFRSGHRCDAHALGQSSQTFLISAYVRLARGSTQRVIFPVTTAQQDLLIGMVHRQCAQDAS